MPPSVAPPGHGSQSVTKMKISAAMFRGDGGNPNMAPSTTQEALPNAVNGMSPSSTNPEAGSSLGSDVGSTSGATR